MNGRVFLCTALTGCDAFQTGSSAVLGGSALNVHGCFGIFCLFSLPPLRWHVHIGWEETLHYERRQEAINTALRPCSRSFRLPLEGSQFQILFRMRTEEGPWVEEWVLGREAVLKGRELLSRYDQISQEKRDVSSGGRTEEMGTAQSLPSTLLGPRTPLPLHTWPFTWHFWDQGLCAQFYTVQWSVSFYQFCMWCHFFLHIFPSTCKREHRLPVCFLSSIYCSVSLGHLFSCVNSPTLFRLQVLLLIGCSRCLIWFLSILITILLLTVCSCLWSL